MKKKALAPLALLTMFASTTPMMASAAPNYPVSKKNIYLNDNLVSAPYGLVANNTTYIPIWYLMQMLKQLNIQSTWNGKDWTISVPANVVPDFSNLTNGQGASVVYLNGTAVEHVDKIVYNDPASRQATTYMPIWYLQQLLTRIGVTYNWNGSDWTMSYTAPTDGNSDNYNVSPASYSTDWGSNRASSTFAVGGVPYMPLDDLVNALTSLGLGNIAAGTSWYTDSIVYSGKTYIPVNAAMQLAKDNGDYAYWESSVLALAHTPKVVPVVNPHTTYSYAQMASDIQKLAAAYPDLVQYKVTGQTAYGRNLYAVSVGKGDATVFINGSHHAREWITSSLNMYMIDQYAQAYTKGQSFDGYNVRDVLDHCKIWFMPMVNPDGVALEQQGLSAFPTSAWAGLTRMNAGSSNFSHWKATAQGIDPNRQYDGGWSNVWFDPVKIPWWQDYKGTHPYEINEVKAVLSLINQTNPQMEIAYHASGQVIYWQYKVSGSQYNVDKAYAQTIGKMTGYSLVNPGPNPSGGGLTDWWTNRVLRPGFTIEVGPAFGDRPVPVGYFDQIWGQNKDLGLYLAREGYKLYLAHPNAVVHAP